MTDLSHHKVRDVLRTLVERERHARALSAEGQGTPDERHTALMCALAYADAVRIVEDAWRGREVDAVRHDREATRGTGDT